jgi:hypothetical protein
MPAELFDMELRALRRDRAFRLGGELFLLERVFEDCLDRLGLLQQNFRSALLIGCPDPAWPDRLRDFAREVAVLDPGPCFARAAGGSCVIEDELELAVERHDLCVAVGTLDTVNDLPQALARIRASLAPNAFFLGAVAGGETLPQLRAAMRTADQVQGVAVPHVHPRIESSMLASLLSGAGFANPVVDIDRVQVSYEDLARLVNDLRGMGATNILKQRSARSMSRAARQAAFDAFAAAGEGGRTVETFEILNFAAWTPAQG